MKKITAFVVLLTFLLALLAGCAGPIEEPAISDGAESSAYSNWEDQIQEETPDGHPNQRFELPFKGWGGFSRWVLDTTDEQIRKTINEATLLDADNLFENDFWNDAYNKLSGWISAARKSGKMLIPTLDGKPAPVGTGLVYTQSRITDVSVAYSVYMEDPVESAALTVTVVYTDPACREELSKGYFDYLVARFGENINRPGHVKPTGIIKDIREGVETVNGVETTVWEYVYREDPRCCLRFVLGDCYVDLTSHRWGEAGRQELRDFLSRYTLQEMPLDPDCPDDPATPMEGSKMLEFDTLGRLMGYLKGKNVSAENVPSAQVKRVREAGYITLPSFSEDGSLFPTRYVYLTAYMLDMAPTTRISDRSAPRIMEYLYTSGEADDMETYLQGQVKEDPTHHAIREMTLADGTRVKCYVESMDGAVTGIRFRLKNDLMVWLRFGSDDATPEEVFSVLRFTDHPLND